VQKAIEVLMDEHRLIERALGSLESYAAAVGAAEPLHRGVVGEYAAFLRGFADECHHGKEEDILFQRLLEHGLPRQVGPLAVMFHEHDLGRAHVRTLIEIAERPGSVAPSEGQEFLACAGEYVPLLRQHILKEDNVLYPLALGMLTGPELDAMNSQFEEFEARFHADGSYERLQALAERLTDRFRPDPSRTPSPAVHACCA
jgi:hemerythrin-like domain-containing protein